MNIKDMRLATGHGKTVAYFEIEWPGEMTLRDCKLIEGKNGLFAGVPQKEYFEAGVKKYKDILKFKKAQQDKVNAAAVEAYRLLGGAAEPKEEEPLW